ncbi:MAG: DNA repair protein RecO [Bacilli bacterium]|nr:DNA repair protein RecO [Bacilli bacterium]
MLVDIEGFILNETAYGETSKIIHVFTHEYGLIGIMCKGAKSLKSRLRAATLKYTYAKFTIHYKENKLSVLNQADILNPLKNIRTDITLISFITYLSELTYQVLKQSNNKEIYEDFLNVILKIETGLDPIVLTNILEIKYLNELGVLFNLDECVICGNKTNIVTISSDKGGYICKDCHTNEMIVDKKVIQMLRMYYYVNIKSISNLKIDDDTKNAINFFLDNYYERYTGLYLNSKKFLKSLTN